MEDHGLTAMSYDSPAILKDFAHRRKIAFLLLSDPIPFRIARIVWQVSMPRRMVGTGGTC
jgi:peroxiredoxin